MGDNVLWGAAIGGALVLYLIFDVVQNMLAKARLAAMQELMDTIIRNVSGRYERADEPLMESVAKAVDDLQDRLAGQKDIRKKPYTYRV